MAASSARCVACVAALLVGGCSWPTTPEKPAEVAPAPPPAPVDASAAARREIVLETALGQIGRPYRYGGGDGDGFDCSGLAQYVYAEIGVQLPRTASEQRRAGRTVSLAEAQPGDLVFFRIDGGTHVGIFVGDGRVVHAPAAGKDVSVSSITTAYWKQRLASVVRVLP